MGYSGEFNHGNIGIVKGEKGAKYVPCYTGADQVYRR